MKYGNKVGKTSDSYKNKHWKKYTRTNSINFWQWSRKHVADVLSCNNQTWLSRLEKYRYNDRRFFTQENVKYKIHT